MTAEGPDAPRNDSYAELPMGRSGGRSDSALVRSARPGPEASQTGKLMAWGPSRAREPDPLILTVPARTLLEGRYASRQDGRHGRADRVGPAASHGPDLRGPG